MWNFIPEHFYSDFSMVARWYVIPPNDRIFCVYSTSEHNMRKKLPRGNFFEGEQNYVENKNKRNESKVILVEFNSALNNLGMDGGNS